MEEPDLLGGEAFFEYFRWIVHRLHILESSLYSARYSKQAFREFLMSISPVAVTNDGPSVNFHGLGSKVRVYFYITRYLAHVPFLSVPLSGQLQGQYISKRSIYEVRERPSRTYGWTAFTTAHILIEMPWNFVGSLLLFLTWYWTVGYPSDRAGYTYLMIGIMYPMYYTTFALVIAAISPSIEIASLLFSTSFSFVLTL